MRKKQAQGDLQRKIVAAMSRSWTPTDTAGDAFAKAMSQQFLVIPVRLMRTHKHY